MRGCDRDRGGRGDTGKGRGMEIGSKSRPRGVNSEREGKRDGQREGKRKEQNWARRRNERTDAWSWKVPFCTRLLFANGL